MADISGGKMRGFRVSRRRRDGIAWRVGLHGIGDAIVGLRFARGFGRSVTAGTMVSAASVAAAAAVSPALGLLDRRRGALLGEIGVLELRGTVVVTAASPRLIEAASTRPLAMEASVE